MSYVFHETVRDLLAGDLDLNASANTTLYLVLVSTGSSLLGRGRATATGISTADLGDFDELTVAGYERKKLENLTVALDTTAGIARFTFSPIQYPALGTGEEVTGALIYQGSTSTGRPRFFLDNAPTFPFTGGRAVVLTSLTAGTVRLSG